MIPESIGSDAGAGDLRRARQRHVIRVHGSDKTVRPLTDRSRRPDRHGDHRGAQPQREARFERNAVRMCSKRRSGSRGFGRKPSVAAISPLGTAHVIGNTGTWEVAGSEASKRIAWRPSSTGIAKSMMMRSGGWDCAFCTASTPFRASSTANPHPVSQTFHSSRKSSVSSTTKMRCGRNADRRSMTAMNANRRT